MPAHRVSRKKTAQAQVVEPAEASDQAPIQPAPKPYEPTLYSREIAQVICDRLAAGESLTAICNDGGMPCTRTVARWVIGDAGPGFTAQYREARDMGLDVLADEVLAIADDSSQDVITKTDERGRTYRGIDHEHVNRSRLRVDARKWYLCKLAPKKYGERLDMGISGSLQVGGLMDRLTAARKRVAESVPEPNGPAAPQESECQ
jgi:hypothetical protein